MYKRILLILNLINISATAVAADADNFAVSGATSNTNLNMKSMGSYSQFDIQKILDNISYDQLCRKVFPEKGPIITWSGGLGKLEIGFMNRAETFYADSISLLSKSKYDQIFYFQNTSDLKFYVKQGDALRSRMVIRNKFRAGEPQSLGVTSESSVKILDIEEGLHTHYVGKLFLWIKEAWFEITLNDLFCLQTKGKHFFKIGIFPFVLGRAISLGDAYAISPGVLDFFSNNLIDQYAPGMLLYGEVIDDRLEYDIYFSTLRNYSGSAREVNEKIYKNVVGRAEDPRRGFGKMNFVFAARAIGIIPNIIGCPGILRIEPYGFFNNDPEQKTEFANDAKSKLATIGLAMDYEGEVFEWGIECANNFGHQTLLPYDRNYMQEKRASDGTQVVAYTKVLDGPPTDSASTDALVSDANKITVDASPRGVAFNGKEIGNSGLYNAEDRFRAGKVNSFSGAMFVADASIQLRKNVKLSSAIQIASGDENPNKNALGVTPDAIDTQFSGFIPFQSIYSGKRVLSLFFLGTGRIARVLSSTPGRVVKSRLAVVESGFTNLMLIGFGADIDTNIMWCQKTRLRPNVLFGWQTHATNKFDIATMSGLDEPADKYLGVEINIFGETELIENLRMFLVGGFFFPGSHYNDVKGRPFTSDQLEALSNPVCGELFGKNSPPILSNHRAFILNIGLIYNF